MTVSCCTRKYLLKIIYISNRKPALPIKAKQMVETSIDTDSLSNFSRIKPAPPVAVFKLTADFKADTNPSKVNLGVGAFRTEHGEPWVLPIVTKAEKAIVNNTALNKEYLPIAGYEPFTSAVKTFVLGQDCKALLEDRVVACQSMSGTGALRLGAEFLKKYHLEGAPVYVSKPTWPNHLGIFKAAGHTDIRYYDYWDAENLCLNFDKMIECFQNAPLKSIFIFHACAHNPTGCDPTRDQWVRIAKVLADRQGFPIFDTAYQGFATGNPEEDAWPVRMFAESGFELFVTTSFSKNFGLYNERVGQLTVVTKDKQYNHAVKSQLEILIRTNYSNPPVHGALIVSTILNNPSFKEEWYTQLNIMSNRIKDMRQLLKSELEVIGTPGKWDHILTQIGMFSYTGLSEKQCDWLVTQRSVYLMKSGRINMCAITPDNVKYVANAIKESFSIE